MGAANQNDVQAPASSHRKHGLGLPSLGFVLSLVFTVLALWLVSLTKHLGREWVITLVLTLAVMQIGIQLFFFMHVTESDERPWHVGLLALAFVLVVTIVAGSIWIMTFDVESY